MEKSVLSENARIVQSVCLLQNTNIIFVDLRAQLGPKLALLCERGVSAGGVLELRGIFASSSSWL